MKNVADVPSYKGRVARKKELNKNVLDRLYGFLNVLDGKANGLLALNGILLAALVVLLSSEVKSIRRIFPVGESFFVSIMIFAFLGLLVSLLRCLQIVNIKWKFLQYMREGKTGIDEELRTLAQEVDRRTDIYKQAWHLTRASGWVILGLVVFSQAIGVVYYCLEWVILRSAGS